MELDADVKTDAKIKVSSILEAKKIAPPKGDNARF